MENNVAILHRCGACNQTFTQEADYLAHQCEATGVAPTHPLHAMGENFLEIQAAALARGYESAPEHEKARIDHEDGPAGKGDLDALAASQVAEGIITEQDITKDESVA